MSYPAPPALGLAETFSLIVDGVRRSAAARIGRQRAPLSTLLWFHLGRLMARFATLVARVEAGQGAPKPRPRSPQPKQAPKPRERLPTGFAWLVRLAGYEVAGRGSQLRHLLNQPEMAALLEAAPQAARLLRPLCRMLAISPAEVPILGPPPVRKPRPKRPSPIGRMRPMGEGASTTPVPPENPRTPEPLFVRYRPPPPSGLLPNGEPPEPGLASFHLPRYVKGW